MVRPIYYRTLRLLVKRVCSSAFTCDRFGSCDRSCGHVCNFGVCDLSRSNMASGPQDCAASLKGANVVK